jgi:hypothetical protein
MYHHTWLSIFINDSYEYYISFTRESYKMRTKLIKLCIILYYSSDGNIFVTETQWPGIGLLTLLLGTLGFLQLPILKQLCP